MGTKQPISFPCVGLLFINVFCFFTINGKSLQIDSPLIIPPNLKINLWISLSFAVKHFIKLSQYISYLVCKRLTAFVTMFNPHSIEQKFNSMKYLMG